MKETRRRNQKWTAQEISFIRDNSHLGAVAIAEALGATVRAVRNIASRQGIPIRGDFSHDYQFTCLDCGDIVIVHRVKPRSDRQTRCSRCRELAWRKANNYKAEATPEQKLLYAARGRAKKKGIPFTITLADIVIPPVCPVLGIPLVQNLAGGPGAGPAPDTPTLDRIIPKLGYVPGNVAVISWRANRLKSDATMAELEALVAWLRSRTS